MVGTSWVNIDQAWVNDMSTRSIYLVSQPFWNISDRLGIRRIEKKGI